MLYILLFFLRFKIIILIKGGNMFEESRKIGGVVLSKTAKEILPVSVEVEQQFSNTMYWHLCTSTLTKTAKDMCNRDGLN